jgi:ubiquinone/menaquinone biosynthesis C-methylase UbiE
MNAADAWSAQADLYADRSSRITELHAADLVACLRPHIVQAKTILEIGCGTGAFAQAYIQQFPRGIPGQTILMTDLATGMLEKANEGLKALSLPADYATKLDCQVQDGTTLEEIPDGSIDLVVSCFGVFLIPNQAAALKAIQRVLKPDGIFGNASWNFPVSDELKSLSVGPGLQELFFLPMQTIDEKAFLEQQTGIERWATEAAIQEHFKDHGSIFQPFTFTKGIHSTSVDWDFFWKLMERNPISKTIYLSANEEQKKAAHDAVSKLLQSHGQEDPKSNSILCSAVSLSMIARVNK